MRLQTKIAIGIQARSTSTRLPNKVTKTIGSRLVIEHVIDSCRACASYINRYTLTNDIVANVYVLIPENDPLKHILSPMSDYVLEGAEDDVLSRYVQLLGATDADYIVRITADCPLIPHHVIYKAINVAVKNGLDYVSNIGDLSNKMRTAIDGDDVEVLSKRALEWADGAALDKKDREHVTTIIRGEMMPEHLRVGVLVGHKDLSHIKLSLDTEEDFEKISRAFESVQEKIANIRTRYGKAAVFRF